MAREARGWARKARIEAPPRTLMPKVSALLLGRADASDHTQEVGIDVTGDSWHVEEQLRFF